MGFQIIKQIQGNSEVVFECEFNRSNILNIFSNLEALISKGIVDNNQNLEKLIINILRGLVCIKNSQIS